jgi:hypothetical protein
VTEVGESGLVRCERCGALKPASGCACGGQGMGQGQGKPTVPAGWDPELTRSARPRLQIVTKPVPDATPDVVPDATPDVVPDATPGPEHGQLR